MTATPPSSSNRPPGVMQPHETFTPRVGTDIPSSRDPMPTEWAGDDYMPPPPAVIMTHSVNSQTQYYNPVDISMAGESSATMDDPTETMDSGADSMDESTTTTIYGIRIGASASATLSSSTLVFTTYSLSTFNSNSQVLTTSIPVTSTTVTLVPMMTGVPPMTFSSSSSRRNTALIVGVTVPLVVLLIAAMVALIVFCRRRRQQQRPRSTGSEASFFPDRVSSTRSSIVDSASEKRLTVRTSTMPLAPAIADADSLDRLELAGPQIQITSALSTAGVSLRDTLAVIPTTTEPTEYLASCQASFVDPASNPQSPSSSSSTSRQEQLVSEMDMAREEIGVLEKRGSPQRAAIEGYVGVAERRIEELYARIRELEREQAALRFEVAMTVEGYPPPDYVTAEG
ncbi:hypothetical protein MVEN_01485500 [Mycena venus]|uniref:Transmembrane protein n=1 Tax=Mycena venus TaxID=2733690 RepID=A0A8H6XVV0_9AGAR|nr:hypothetical protein MVEN_01485500 [Mycena venus]